jgi:hypothetical protein
VHVPAPAGVTDAPDTVHTAVVVDANDTASIDDAVALTVNAALPNALLERAANVMVCAPAVTMKL